MFYPTFAIQLSKIHILSLNDDILFVHRTILLRSIVVVKLAAA